MIVAGAPLVVAVVGLVVWFVASLPRPAPSPMRPWAAELGRLVFFIGLLVLVATLNTTAWRFTVG